MTIMVKVEAKIKAGCLRDAIDFLSENFPEAREYSGCQDVTAYLNEEESRFVFIEHWDSKEAFTNYMAWRQESGTFYQFLDMIEGDPDIKYYTRTNA